MKDILSKVGIKEFDNAVYSYYPQDLTWWDEDYRIAIEIEVEKDEIGNRSIAVLFSVSDEEVKERDAVFICEFSEGHLLQDTLVTDAVAEHLKVDDKLNYLKDEEAYATGSYETATEVLGKIVGLIESPQFVQRTSFCNLPQGFDEMEGDTLNNFLAMYDVAYDEYTGEYIREHLEASVAIEGSDFIKELKADLHSDTLDDVMEEHGINAEVIQLIREEVLSFQEQ
ncbi:MAG: hypothetical protein WBB45_03040 [Cyclobacteriaceae bacterium]